ncbi:hypothetical protein [Flavobacterium psychrophilum]|uniref:hypothetical protein n=1 Tax=Flavobacterium psychrophilum TaxID=96345 RepID=UPI000B7C0ED0|nr:hypothetical protein [Flavobacterium psychrophilum]MCB6089453.1 hypothetical protein [Flavobacterium psychrophilum]MCB6232072.1 hypothetical protein [Flavobacterium psychrophilum]SNA80309.1 hypothetical protein FI146_340008 [Flavobacterium psychrophilum]SNB13535.1 hypothetical protein JIP1600_2250005 [Flavobacterium psychrophilum]
MTIYEKTFYNLKQIEETLTVLIQELETAKVHKRDIDKVNTLLTKIDICKRAFNDK